MMYSMYKLNKQGNNIQSIVLLPQFGISLLFHMSSSNCCFLTCIQVLQEASKVVLYSHLFKNFPQFIVIHTVKGFGILNKAEVDAFLEKLRKECIKAAYCCPAYLTYMQSTSCKILD